MPRPTASSPISNPPPTPTARWPGCAVSIEEALAIPRWLAWPSARGPIASATPCWTLLAELAGRTWVTTRIWPANDPRPHARLARPRAPRRRVSRCGRTQPPAGAGDRRPRHPGPAGRVARGHAGHRPAGCAGLGIDSVKLHNLYAVRTPGWPNCWPPARCGCRSGRSMWAAVCRLYRGPAAGLRRRPTQRRCPAAISRRPRVVPG